MFKLKTSERGPSLLGALILATWVVVSISACGGGEGDYPWIASNEKADPPSSVPWLVADIDLSNNDGYPRRSLGARETRAWSESSMRALVHMHDAQAVLIKADCRNESLANRECHGAFDEYLRFRGQAEDELLKTLLTVGALPPGEMGDLLDRALRTRLPEGLVDSIDRVDVHASGEGLSRTLERYLHLAARS